MGKIKAFFRWVLFLAWLALAFFLSVQAAQASGEFSWKIASFLGELLSKAGLTPANGFHETLRNGAHFALHAVLAFLGYRAFACFARSPRGVIGVTFVVSTVMAVVDEVAQFVAPGRVFELSDLGLNIFGILAGLVFAVLVTGNPKMAYANSTQPTAPAN